MPIEPAGEIEFAQLPTIVGRFLSDGDCISVTMTIRLTDDGLSIGRRDGGYDMTFLRIRGST